MSIGLFFTREGPHPARRAILSRRARVVESLALRERGWGEGRLSPLRDPTEK